jgi:4-aminobutyrate aminotransferase
MIYYSTMTVRHIPGAISKLHKTIYPIYAKGSYLYTGPNKKFLDLTSGIGALGTGHNHPYIIDKVKQQLDKYVHMPQQVFQSHPMQTELTDKMVSILPNNLDNIFYVNSGSEATDNALKIARKYTGKTNIITMNGGFHGRSIAALSVTSSNLNCRRGMVPLLSNILFCPDFNKSSIDKILDYQSAPEDTAAFILESVQGEGGIHSIDADSLSYIKDICIRNNILLIADEVQCGSMRTGSWWNIVSKGVVPDIMTFGKGIASGYPLAGVVANTSIMDSLGPGYLGGTYGGNAICSAAASATIDILDDQVIKDNVSKMGQYIRESLEGELGVKDIRQYGLMIAIELYKKDEFSNITMRIVEKLRDGGILVLVAGKNNSCIRLLPPLNICKDDVDIFLDRFNTILKGVYE